MEFPLIFGAPFLLVLGIAAQTALDSALHINRATTTIAVAGLNLPVFAAMRMGEIARFAMLIVAGLGASMNFDSDFVTRRQRAIEIVAWSLAGLTLAGTVAFFVMLSRMPHW